MSLRPVLFLSAVSKELKTARQHVAMALYKLGFDPRDQDMAATEQGELCSVLRRWIDESAGVVQIVGKCYGTEPKAPPDGFARCSYTQYEALYAHRQGKPVWYLPAAETYLPDHPNPEPPELQQLQQDYSESIRDRNQLRHSFTNLTDLENLVWKLEDRLKQLRAEAEARLVRLEDTAARTAAHTASLEQHAAHHTTGLRLLRNRFAGLTLAAVLIAGGVLWIKWGQHESNAVYQAIMDRDARKEQALLRLADAEMTARQFGAKLSPEELRRRAYTILENELGLPAGSLANELPAFALELYNRSDTTLLMRARAAHVLNKFEEAEKLFLQSEAEAAAAHENAEQVADKLRTRRIESLEGAGWAAEKQMQYPRALTHFEAAAALTLPDRNLREWALVELHLNHVLLEAGRLAEGETRLSAVIARMRQALPPGDPAPLTLENLYANALWARGKYPAAEAAHRAVAEQLSKIKGPRHPLTLMCRTNLAMDLQATGQAAGAESELRDILALQLEILGPENEETLETRNALANALRLQGRNSEAETEHRALAAIRGQLFGAENRTTLMSRNNAAVALQAQGQYSAAEHEHREILDIRLRVLGADHPETLMSRSNLASTLRAQDKYEEAETENRIVLVARERVLGPGHPDTLRSRNNLANVLYEQRKFPQAEEQHRAVLAERERILGPDHPDTLNSHYNLALCLEAQGNEIESRPLWEDALGHAQAAQRGGEHVLGAEHPQQIKYAKEVKDLHAKLRSLPPEK